MNHSPSRIFHRALALLLALLLASFAPACAEEARQRIRVGFFAFDGYHMIDEGGERSGYGCDFLRLISRYLDVDFEFVGYENSWDDMQDMLADGSIDMVTSAQMTPERMDEFAFSKPIGTSSAMLTASSRNWSIVAGEYGSYDGMRVGMLLGNSRNDDLAEFAAENGFSYTPIYFELAEELEQALQSGEVDAALTSSLRRTQDERVLDLFAAHDFYVMVRKDDMQLLRRLNYAINQLNAVEGDWKNDLNNRYYAHLEDRELAFTAEEQALIQQYASGERTLVMSASHDRVPYSYVEDGQLKGIIIDYFDMLADYIGIPYELKVPVSREEYQQWRMDCVIDGTMDARIDSMSWVEDNSYCVSAPYTTMRLAVVTRRDFDGEIRRLAVATAQGLFGIEDNFAPSAQRIDVASREEGMRAVLDGKADAVVVYLYTAQQFVNQDERGLLTYTLLEEPTYEYCVAFTPNVSHVLSGIFTKAIYAMPGGMFEDLAAEYTSYRAKDVDFLTWIKIYPLPAILLCTGLFLMCLFAVLLFERQKAVRLEQKRSAELSALAVQAERANRAKSDFLANVSHDIRTPMNAIVGFANLMDGRLDDPAQLHEYIQKIRFSSSHLLSLIDDVLDMSRIEANKITLLPAPISLTDQIRQVEDITRGSAAERDQRFWVEIHDLEHDAVVADAVRLRQVLLNLLSNAVKYTPSGGSISLSLREFPGARAGSANYCFTVADNGSGMTKDFLDRIFEPFARSEASVTNTVQGTGLGMAITKNLLDRMKGEISVESAPGKGSRFELLLSFPIASADGSQHTELAAESGAIAGMRFLCAEDNALNAEILEATLRMHGAECTIYPDGAQLVQAFDALKPEDYDVILMDIQMPNMNGLEATHAIRASENPLGARIPIIAMTANAFADDVRQSREMGMNAHISKPLDMSKLLRALAEVGLRGGDE